MPRRAAALAAAKNISHISDDDEVVEEEDVAKEFENKESNPTNNGMNDDEKLTKLCTITGSTRDAAINLLSACNGSLEMAIDMFTEDNTEIKAKAKAKKSKKHNAKSNKKESSDEEFISSQDTTEDSHASSPDMEDSNRIKTKAKAKRNNPTRKRKQISEEEYSSEEDTEDSDDSSTEGKPLIKKNRKKRKLSTSRKSAMNDSKSRQSENSSKR